MKSIITKLVTRVDDGICHKCDGRGKVLPRLTVKNSKKLKTISNRRRKMILNVGEK